MACCGTPPTRAGFPAKRAATELAKRASASGKTSICGARIVEQRVVNACIQALDDLQDYIDEATHDPWPGDRAPSRPYAEIHGTRVVLGYGSPDAPVLECEPIPLDAV